MDNEQEKVDSIEALQHTIEIVRKAQKEFSKYTQEQVDKIFQAAAIESKQNTTCKNGSRRNRNGSSRR